MNNIKYIFSLIENLVDRTSYIEQLCALLTSSDIEETLVNPRIFPVLFIIKQSIIRLENTKNNNTETFGLPSLIDSLRYISTVSNIAFFSMRNTEWSGGCYVFQDKLVGCEFVKRGAEQSRQGLWLENTKLE